MVKAEREIKGYNMKKNRSVKIQSYADDNIILINSQEELEKSIGYIQWLCQCLRGQNQPGENRNTSDWGSQGQTAENKIAGDDSR